MMVNVICAIFTGTAGGELTSFNWISEEAKELWMSTLDREPRATSIQRNGPLYEPRIDSGVNTLTPPRLGPKSPRAVTIPRGQVMTGAEKRMPLKR